MNMKYYIVRVVKYANGEQHKTYKKYKCIDGYSTKKEECWKFSKQGALGIIENLKRYCRAQYDKGLVDFYLEKAE